MRLHLQFLRLLDLRTAVLNVLQPRAQSEPTVGAASGGAAAAAGAGAGAPSAMLQVPTADDLVDAGVAVLGGLGSLGVPRAYVPQQLFSHNEHAGVHGGATDGGVGALDDGGVDTGFRVADANNDIRLLRGLQYWDATLLRYSLVVPRFTPLQEQTARATLGKQQLPPYRAGLHEGACNTIIKLFKEIIAVYTQLVPFKQVSACCH